MPDTARGNSKEIFRILLVEDSKRWQVLLKRQIDLILKEMRRSAEIRICSTASKASKALDENHPWHLLITDIDLRDGISKSGLELAQEARDKPVPCIVVSGAETVTKKDVNTILRQYKAYEFFEKPLDYDRFRLLVKRVLRGEILDDSSPGWMFIKPTFQARNVTIEDKKVFVLMPFTEEESWPEKTWHELIFLCEELGMEAVRADDMFGEDIMEDVWQGICTARIVIADTTGRNANVFYELGIAHTLGKKVVLISQSPDDIPFDVSRYRHIIYKESRAGYNLLHEKAKKTIEALLKE